MLQSEPMTSLAWSLDSQSWTTNLSLPTSHLSYLEVNQFGLVVLALDILLHTGEVLINTPVRSVVLAMDILQNTVRFLPFIMV